MFITLEGMCLALGALTVYVFWYRPLREECDNLYQAIRVSGYGLMKCSNGWFIHDVSEKAKADEERTAKVIEENIELQQKVAQLTKELENVPLPF